MERLSFGTDLQGSLQAEDQVTEKNRQAIQKRTRGFFRPKPSSTEVRKAEAERPLVRGRNGPVEL